MAFCVITSGIFSCFDLQVKMLKPKVPRFLNRVSNKLLHTTIHDNRDLCTYAYTGNFFLEKKGKNRIIVPCCWKVVAQKWRIGKPKFHFPRDNFHFPRLDSCLAERSEAKQSKSRKMKVLSRKMKMRLRDSPFQSNYFHAAWIYFLCF